MNKKTIIIIVIILFLAILVLGLSYFDDIKILTGFFGPSKLIADLDNDSEVSDQDIDYFLDLYEQGDTKVDFNQDGVVDKKDAAIFIDFLLLVRQ